MKAARGRQDGPRRRRERSTWEWIFQEELRQKRES